jgi:hypothetical protein
MFGGRLRDPRRSFLVWLRGTDGRLRDCAPRTFPAVGRLPRGSASYSPTPSHRRRNG